MTHFPQQPDRGAGPGLTAGSGCPALIDLAAYVDDRLDADECERIEAHLAACPPCIMAVDDARALSAHDRESLPFIAADVLHAAAALVKPAASRPLPAVFGWRAFARWSAAAAAALVVCVTGYRVGLASADAGATAAADLTSEVSFGLFAGESSELDVFAEELPEVTS